jgi:hypothetical protein
MFSTSDEKLNDVGKNSIPLHEDQTAVQDDTKTLLYLHHQLG